MTAITSYVAACRRPGELGVHSLDHFALTVPDLEVARKFYSSFGLDVPEEGGGRLGMYTSGNPHRWGLVDEGKKKKLNYISFGLYEEDIGPFRARLQAQGVKQLDPPKGLESNGVWFRDHDNNLLEAKVAEKVSPAEKARVEMLTAAGGYRGAPGRSAAPLVKPRRFSHLLLFTTDVPKAIDFYTRVVGLRLSDRSGDIIAFMHGIHGSDHHMLAFAKSEAPGHHHFSWDVGSVMDIGLGAKQMLDKGYAKGWGLGRHVLGSNYFHYVRDPWGSYSEYACDIDYVPVDCDWDAGDHPGEDSIYVWGPEMPPEFIENYEAKG